MQAYTYVVNIIETNQICPKACNCKVYLTPPPPLHGYYLAMYIDCVAYYYHTYMLLYSQVKSVHAFIFTYYAMLQCS